MEKRQIAKSFFWTALETYSTQGIAFIVSIFMARMLSPGDYGILGIIGVFIALSDTFIDSGFTNALINKKECTNADYSTVFYFNIGISILFFCILFFLAPIIAQIYENETLVWTTRAMALTFIISSFGAVPMTILTKELRFKSKAIITFSVSIFSGIIGLVLAYSGFGVWALIWQSVLSVLFRVLIYIVYTKWHPVRVFSRESFKNLFEFGSKLLCSNIIYTLYNNIYNLVIGKVFNATQLGYFTRADGYSKLIPSNISGILGKILFPILSKIKDNDEELKTLHHEFILITSFFIFPGCMFLAGLSRPLVFLLITEKWMPIVPLLQILCISGIFEHFSTINGNFILSKGVSGLFMRMQIITKPIGIIILAITIFTSLEIVAWGKVLYSIVCFFVGYFYLRKILAISLKSSIMEILKLFCISSGICLIYIKLFNDISLTWLNLIIAGIGGLLLYIIIASICCRKTMYMIKQLKNLNKQI